ncbi:hypothetical protein Q4S45_07865 [Massilia sp. R2A-15]|uniref:hypothetical protein n=1 Tax=Massilia sp. R2A-15 TaxID=3064278 RepID=UPI0027360733|nr:hypothetical protein [Massilia sp. R2A-15]WLI91023.1 hypothetical protein Q4S45_07865 [Massilia sp. R2A-15]
MNAAALSAPPSIGPPSGMLAYVPPGHPARFSLCCDAWHDLLAFLNAACALPAATRGSGPMQLALAAAEQCGNPGAIRAALRESPSLLDAWEAPAGMVAHTAWLAKRLADAAGMLASGFESALRNLPDVPAKEQAAVLTAWLFDRAVGPVPLAQAMAAETERLVSKFRGLEGSILRCSQDLELEVSVPRAAKAVGGILGRLVLLEAAWVQVHSHMALFGNSINEAHVGAQPFLDPARSRRAIAAWKTVGEACGRFAASLGYDDEGTHRRQA